MADESRPFFNPKGMAEFTRKMDQRNLDAENRKAWRGAQEKEQENILRGRYPDKFDTYKKGGKVKATGKAKVHKGEYVIKKAAADKLGPKKLASLNQANRDKKILQKTRFR